MSKNTEIVLPSMLSFDRKLETSDGLMFAGNWDDRKKNHLDDEKKTKAWSEIKISQRQNRSTQSALGIDDKKKPMPNPVSSDSDDANLPMNKDTLKLSFSLRVIGDLGKPFACNKPDFSDAIQQKVKAFKDNEDTKELALRYAYNIANGRFLWRNRVGVETIEIQVNFKDKEKPLTFNAYDYSLNDFDKNRDHLDLQTLATEINKGLSGDEETFVLIQINAFVKLGAGQHVFPSQEMNMGEKKKKLFELNGSAAMHNVKIGNALRTIDNWYGDTMLIKSKNDKGKDSVETVNIESDIKCPIAIEPYGSVTQHGRAYRPNKIDLYTLMKAWVNVKEGDKDIDENQKKFVVANLIRGGVFGGDSE